MHWHIREMLAWAALATCSGCAGDPAYRIPTKLYSNTDISVVRVYAHRDADGIVVTGDVRRPDGYAGVVPGHLRVTGLNDLGRVVAVTDANWGEFMNRRFRLAYFRTFLRTETPLEIVTVSVEPITRRQP
ncbi:MAG: hypothetical protein ABIR08_13370 [Sphingomonas sp.]